MAASTSWSRLEAEAQIKRVLDAAKSSGQQLIADDDGTFEITYRPTRQSLSDLLSKPGPIIDDDQTS